ncbi:2,4-dienoyl-CoA reductase FadH (plasmid) [Cupriavidus necator N-1]|uniref:2,4-dienoyl-CoA reductase FadH n=1 Tax=Cupriavidus necator (strain ATCC 43291 / DSM 13513 / CCUG 52238 / LMG 8453 / N-1) TaxID=1042878 RepID=F8GX80_CUPNN|nr:SDR family oxidoreductase [Cupriavidus necator]AEI81950.1 2,4-dienoyl-CoA reductase FadH [Cupriavidus necator N-1]MDX6008271.1 SDR family oxidoreductase [Cupriavidus necator]
MQINLDFKGRHAFVFGGTTGINFGIAQAFARQGASVTVASRKRENVEAASEVLAKFGGPVHGVCADVRDFDAVGQAFAESVERFGPVDVLVSGAAGNFLCEAKDMSSNGFRVVVDIDLVGTFHVLRQAYDHLRKPGASVINITAPQSFVPMRYQAHASAAKAGVDQLTRVLALEWGGDGIRINSISPGPIEDTEGFRRLMAPTEQDRAAAQAHVPMHRFGAVDDIANLALFLGSPYAGYISGSLIPCDGGGALESVKTALELAGRSASAASKSA